jgi:hypothetical protein
LAVAYRRAIAIVVVAGWQHKRKIVREATSGAVLSY